MKKLLIQLKENIALANKYDSGICLVVRSLEVKGDITLDEMEKLHQYILKHRPKRGVHYDPKYKKSAWYWKHGLIEPRVAWLDYLIARFK